MTTIKATGSLWKPYARICHLIQFKAMSHQAIARSIGWQATTVSRFLRMLHSMDLVHVPHWSIPVARGSKPGECWRLGYGLSEPCPPTLKGTDSRQHNLQKPQFRSNWIAFANVLRCLERGATPKEIRESSGLSENSFRELRAYMHEDLRMIYISSWRRRKGAAGGPHQPVFKLGSGEDAARPAPLPMNAHRKAWRDRQRALRQELGYSVFSAHTPVTKLALARV